MRRPALHIFEGYGLELEYMIVGRDTLDILPVSDEVLKTIAGRYVNEAGVGAVGLCNEFVLHVIEMQNIAPAPEIKGLSGSFQAAIDRINAILEPMGGTLMPTSMHPWMVPAKEARIWPRRFRSIYRTYDRIFGCKRHGWANVQSMQVNVSFSGDDEFRRLHAAVRTVLPIIPALAASSPVVEGRVTGTLDNRLVFYRENQAKVPSISGSVIPEPVYTKAEYESEILERIYRDIAPYDTEGMLRYEWLNSRGAIARFDRDAIEVRLADIQECPAADMAVATAVVAALKAIAGERWVNVDEAAAWEAAPLLRILEDTTRDGERAVIRDAEYLRTFGFPEKSAAGAELWAHIVKETLGPDEPAEAQVRDALDMILTGGTLARRILRALGDDPTRERLREVYGRLSECLREGKMFID